LAQVGYISIPESKTPPAELSATLSQFHSGNWLLKSSELFSSSTNEMDHALWCWRIAAPKIGRCEPVAAEVQVSAIRIKISYTPV
jgi:hypothetical protein